MLATPTSKRSRLSVESLPRYGRLPAPKIPPVIQEATILASICGAEAAAVTQRTSPEDGLVAHLSPCSPSVRAGLPGCEETHSWPGNAGRIAQSICLSQKSSFPTGKMQLHSRMLVCSLLLLLCSYLSHPSSNKERREA
jgi:hypothetical protein